MSVEKAIWSVPLGSDNVKLEFIRDFCHFEEGRAAGSPNERVFYKTVEFSQEVVSAEVFLSGFNMRYTREGHDHEIMQLRVDAWAELNVDINPEFNTPEQIRKTKRTVNIKLMYAMTDEDTSDDDDFNEAWVGFTVVAHTKLQS